MPEWFPGELAVTRRRRDILPSRWAEEERRLPSGKTAEPGKFRWDRTPFLVEIIDTPRTRPTVREIVVQGPAQFGKTTLAENWHGHCLDIDPSPAMFFLADQQTAEKVSKDRIAQMIRQSRSLSKLIVESKLNIGEIELANGATIEMGWGSSIAKAASRPVKYLTTDEINKPGYEANGDEGGAMDRLAQRVETFDDYVWFKTSTPTIDTGNITRELETADEIRDYHVPCPACGAEQPLRFTPTQVEGFGLTGGVVWDGGKDATRAQVEAAGYRCASCHAVWTTAEKNAAVGLGRWKPRNACDEPRKVAFQVNRLMSLFPGGRLSAIVRGFLEAQRSNDPLKMQAWVNNVLGEPWTSVVAGGEITEAQVLAARSNLPALTVPDDALALVAFIDTQKVGFWYVVRAVDRDGTSWLVDHGRLDDWEAVESLLYETRYQLASDRARLEADTDATPGPGVGIWRAGIDIGGGGRDGDDESTTEQVLQWVRSNLRRGVQLFACKGSSKPLPGKIRAGSVLEKTPGGKQLPGGVRLWMIDTHKVKSVLHWRFKRAAEKERGGAYLNGEVGDDYARHITAEQLRNDRKRGEYWHRTRHENHWLDCEAGIQAITDPGAMGGVLFVRRRKKKAAASEDPGKQGPAQEEQTKAPEAPAVEPAAAAQRPKPPHPRRKTNPYLSGGLGRPGNPFLTGRRR